MSGTSESHPVVKALEDAARRYQEDATFRNAFLTPSDQTEEAEMEQMETFELYLEDDLVDAEGRP